MIAELYKIILDRKENPPDSSYTASLFDKGLAHIAQKVGEEGRDPQGPEAGRQTH